MSRFVRFPFAWLLWMSTAAAVQPPSLPLSFEENLGQAPSSIRYLARTAEANFFLEARGITLSLRHSSTPLLITFANSAPCDVAGEDLTQDTSNYFVGDDPADWRTGVRHFRKIRYRNLYPGIDAIFYSSGSQLEFDLILQPGADLDQLSFRIDGASAIQLHDGDLAMHIGDAELRLRKPFAYQVLDNKKHIVSTKFRLAGNTVRFDVGPHSKNAALVIDPVFDYATYLGGSGAEWAYSVAADNSGAIYVAGVTQSANFPAGTGMQRTFAGGLGDIFITKFKPDGSGVQYSTYIGGTGAEGDTQGYVGGIAVDTSGNAYITGVTRSPDFPTTAGTFQPVFGTHDSCGSGPTGGPCGDAFILKLNPTGTALVYSSFLGGSHHDEAKALALDSGNNAYVTGITTSSDFPTTTNAFDRLLQYQDAFISKISSDGSHLLYSTLLGGSGYDLSLAIAVDPQGRAHVAGMTESADFPLRRALDSELDPPWDAFITRLAPDGSDIELSTLLGGSGTQQVLGIALDTVGDIYVAGYTDSADFPIVNAFQPDYGGGGGNGFVTKLKADGSSVVYSTFIGGQDAISELDAIHVNDRGEAYVAGSGGADFPVVTSTRAYAGAADAVLAKLTPDGSGVYYSSFFGGNGYDLASSIALDPSGYLLIAGETTSTSMPTHWAAPQRIFGGVSDAFVARFSDTIADGPILSAPKLINVGTAYVNQPSLAKSLRISNTGTRPLHITSVSTSSNITTSTDCSTVQPGAGCNLNASLTLASSAPGVGTITLYDDAPDSPQTFTVRGTGSHGGDLEVVSLAAGASFQSYGITNIPFTAVVRNNGPYDSDSITLRVSNNIGGSECTPCAIGSLAAGASTTVRFNRTPATYGMVPVSVTVVAGSHSPDINSSNDSRSVTIAVPIYSVSASNIDAGTQPVNTTGALRRIVFSGLGYGTFHLALSVSGDFVQTNTCGTANDDGCFIDIFFKPAVSGQRVGTLVINESVAGTTQTIPLTGTGILAPYLSLSNSALDFGTRMIGRPSPTKTLVLTNSGSAALQIVSISSTPEFSADHNCPASLLAAGVCNVNLVFTPLASGPRNGTLTIQDNAGGNPHTLSLIGTGTAAPLVMVPSSVDFGPQRLGIASASQTISITNVGSTAVHVSNVSSPSGFQQTNNCANLQPDASCQLILTFTPVATGTIGGSLTIHDDGFGSPRTLSVSGTGVQPALGLDRNSLSFPSTRVNATAPTQFVTLLNTGNTSILLQSVNATGDFSVTNGCGSIVPASASCYLVIDFRPTAFGIRTGEVVINDDAPGSPHRVSLSGTGRALLLNLLPSSLSYAAQAVGSSSLAQTVLLTNDTPANVTMNSVIVSGDYSQTNGCPPQLAPDASCTINIVFSPKAAGARNGTLTFTGSTGVHTVLLSGTGAASAASISPGSILFVPTLVGGSSTQTILIRSTGGAPLSIGTPSVNGTGFSYLSSCPKSLAGGQTCSVTVRFTPAAVGLSQGSLRLVDDAPGSPRTVALSGTGVEVSINTGRPQRSNRNTPSVKPTQSRTFVRAQAPAPQSSSSTHAVFGAFYTGTYLALKNHRGSNAGGTSGAPDSPGGKPVTRQLNSLLGSTAPGDRRNLSTFDEKILPPSDQDVATLGGDVGPSLVRNDLESRGGLVDRLHLEATCLQPEAGSSFNTDLPADQLCRVPPVTDTTQAEHTKRSSRQ